ncbi:MAG TPA: ATP-dependent Clp protease adaptor ClpS [Chitinophaga sp.]|uniref:ATP-dependent Clp protease adaptor ClpS n=1 Tax=Chitinophaga sp. TaxID=1869181 RepID=UPI002D164B55|nr:ATP-dependent Clp protease adaptor ClpS [Chitinophaga sp.]HVI45676.1 ATP-dependent Clp protease adaptor ClpS [Chitinophaga sp.]
MSKHTNTEVLPEELEDVLVAEDEQFPFSLIVWNDDVNTFDWVISSLMEVCGHTHHQAEQCALIIHHNGKYAVKEGEYIKLRPLCEALLDRGISATIEEMADK